MSTAIDELLALPWTQRSAAPHVQLVAAFPMPFDGAVAAARTCYSPRGVVSPADVAPEADSGEAGAARRERRDRLAQELYQAGHHTVFQHAHFTFALSNVSRQFVWSFLHAHPFYNSEQVSQRYVRVRDGNALLPELGAATPAFAAALEASYAAYDELRALLVPVCAEAFYERFPGRSRRPELWRGAIDKRAQEIARYVLPIGTFTYLHHTISGLTLMRYLRLAEHPDTPVEQRYVVARMVAALTEVAPGYRAVLEPPLVAARQLAAGLAQQSPTGPAAAAPGLADDRFAELVSYTRDAEALVTQALAEVLGRPVGSDEIERILDPAHNATLGENLNLAYHDKLLRAFVHVHYVFRKRLSHAADSQDQRHRMTPGSRPILVAHIGSEPDVVEPLLVAATPSLRARFAAIVGQQWQTIGELRRRGVDPHWLQYLLPNAVAIRFTESADFLALRHKHLMRLCYNAQEEIWRASLEEAEAVAAVHPRLARFLHAPCRSRAHAGTVPICPEGSRFCGVPVWKLDRGEFARRI